MTNAPESFPPFGLYRAVVPEDVPAVRSVAEGVGAAISEYLSLQGSDMPVRVRQDFGITFVPFRAMQERLQAPAAQDFDLENLAAAVRRIVKPTEVSPLRLPLYDQVRINNDDARHPQLKFPTDAQGRHLWQQSRLLADALAECILGLASTDSIILRFCN
ncbi:MAG TPA: hypothetical protein VLI54_03375 [Bacillota bacterium]|nr:hypothetical protein [Bacillota bacterium]